MTNKYIHSVLHEFSKPQVLTVFLENGADSMLRTQWLETAEDIAQEYGQHSALQLLQRHQMTPKTNRVNTIQTEL